MISKPALIAVALATATASAKPRVRVEIHSEPILVQHERHDLATAVGEFLARNGYELVPAAELDRLTRIARDGRSLSTDQVCGEPVPPSLVFERELTGVRLARTFVACDRKRCDLIVSVEEAKRWEASLPAHPTPAQLIAAVKRLKAHEVPETGEGGLIGGSMGSHVGVDLTLDQEGIWPVSPRTAIEGARSELDACATDVRRTMMGNSLVLDIAPSGAVTACEPELPNELPPANATCLCATLGKVDFGKAKGARRLRADAYHHLAEVLHGATKITTAWIDSLRSTDPTVTWARNGVSSHALSACVPADLAIPETWNGVAVSWHVDAHGHPTKGHARIPGAPPALVRCIDTALATATFACPQGGSEVDVTGVLSIVTSDH